ncbi:MAG TPA: ComEC/Rec2 family competence protein [Gemmataceae bacterium]|nr:ComEC/Rec2 family competence protein [Gemmataceae bacterium]
MASPSLPSTAPLPSPAPRPAKTDRPPGLQPVEVIPESIRRAPLLTAALALTAGILVDRQAGIALGASLITVVAALAAWSICRLGRQIGLARLYLALALAAFGAAYHHWRRDVYRADDLGHHAPAEPRPVRLRGVLLEEPVVSRRPPGDPLRSIPGSDTTRAVLGATALKRQGDWITVSGRAYLTIEGRLQGLHVGDAVEVVGRLTRPEPPANPGEVDRVAQLRDQGIQAVVTVPETPAGLTRQAEGWRYSFHGWLAVVRSWGQRILQEQLPEPQSDVARALLLGEGAAMTGDHYEKYLRTGVIHVLVVSGQHLVILAWLLGIVLRPWGVRRRKAAWLVALVVLGYALLTGGQPPVMRAAVIVGVFSGGILLRRTVNPANALAAAWLVVAALNPTDLFTVGCQLSFLAVAVLYHPQFFQLAEAVHRSGLHRWFRPDHPPVPPDPLEQLLEESRPQWQRRLRAAGRWVLAAYVVNAVVWAAITPLAAYHSHLVSPVALLIGPPLVLLTTVVLIAGFLLLLAVVVCGPVAPVFAWVLRWTLTGCDSLVDGGDRLPGAWWYVSDVPEGWLWIFYLLLFGVLLVEPLRRRWRWLALAWLVWLGVGLLNGAIRSSRPELRCTFLAVGHGGCTVLETPDGRTILYDAGAMTGPDVTRRQIAPFLWHRGIGRIDEIFLSHAHLDHFNGLPALLDRFAVGQVTCTPTFEDQIGPGTRLALDVRRPHSVPVRVVRAGDRLTAGEVTMEVLHPPAAGPEGSEDVRSLVLLVRHAGHSILLTGDLRNEGLRRLLSLPSVPVDVLMAPHHGSRLADPAKLADWARPAVVVSCQGRPIWPMNTPEVYEQKGARFLGTWPHGAVTIRSRPEELVVETYRSRQRIVIRSGPAP